MGNLKVLSNPLEVFAKATHYHISSSFFAPKASMALSNKLQIWEKSRASLFAREAEH